MNHTSTHSMVWCQFYHQSISFIIANLSKPLYLIRILKSGQKLSAFFGFCLSQVSRFCLSQVSRLWFFTIPWRVNSDQLGLVSSTLIIWIHRIHDFEKYPMVVYHRLETIFMNSHTIHAFKLMIMNHTWSPIRNSCMNSVLWGILWNNGWIPMEKFIWNHHDGSWLNSLIWNQSRFGYESVRMLEIIYPSNVIINPTLQSAYCQLFSFCTVVAWWLPAVVQHRLQTSAAAHSRPGRTWRAFQAHDEVQMNITGVKICRTCLSALHSAMNETIEMFKLIGFQVASLFISYMNLNFFKMRSSATCVSLVKSSTSPGFRTLARQQASTNERRFQVNCRFRKECYHSCKSKLRYWLSSRRTGSRWSPVRTRPVAPLWCDLGFFPNSRGNKAAANLRP